MKQEQTSFAKVTRPIIKGAFARDRLFRLLDRMRERPIIWVSGPPGCGKTTLVTSYLEARELPCLWYQIDEGDTDPATFFYYMGLAAKKAAPRKRKPLPLLTPEYLPGLPTFTLRYFENLYHRLKAPSLVVLDNYQEVTSESLIHEVIKHGLSHIPEGINVVLISRGEPPSPLIRFQANNLMEDIGWGEFRLTPEEASGIVQLYARKMVSQEAIEHLHTATDGWLAGLMLMLKTADREKIDPRMLDTVPLEQIFSYFAGEILDKADSEAQAFLLKTAFLPKMTAKMAEELTGFGFASRLLSRLHRNHCFTMRHLHSPPAYEYHPLFRDFLLFRAQKTFSQDDLSALRQRAAVLLEEADQTEAAIALLHDSGDWEGMVRIILKHAAGMLARGRYRPLAEWLVALPEEMLSNTPWLLYWIGASSFPFDLSKSRDHFEQAFTKFKSQDDTAGAFLAWTGVIDSISYGQEDYVQLDQWVQELEAFMQGCPAFPSPEIEARVAGGMLTALVLRQPQHPDIEAWAERVLSLPEDQSSMGAKMMTLFHLVMHYARLGNVERMELAIETSRQLSRNKNAPLISLIYAKMAEGMRSALMSSSPKGLVALSEGLELSRTTGFQVFHEVLLGTTALIALDANDLKSADRYLEEMASSLHTAPALMTSYYHFLKTREALIRRDLQMLSHHADLALRLADDVGAPYNMALVRLLKAQVLHELGKHGEAAQLLARALSIARQIKSKILEFNVFMTQAQFALDRGEEASGLTSLREALAMGKEQRYLNTVIDQPSVTAGLCIKALEAGIEVDYVQEIIRRRKLVPDTPPVHLENWPWAVKIFTMGRFALVIQEEPFSFSGRVRQKPFSLLKALIAMGGRGVHEHQIQDALWPDAEGDAASNAFSTTLHRLRKLLGNENVIRVSDGKVFLDDRYCWVDVWPFERVLGRAERAWEKGERPRDFRQAAELTEEAMVMNPGVFLPGDSDSWVIPFRERLKDKFLRCVRKLGQYYEELGQREKAIHSYNKGLEVDPLVEYFYRRIMLCYHQLGLPSEAISIYKRCCENISAGLGVEPSDETKDIYQSLL